MQSPVSQIVNGEIFEFKYSSFILQTQLESVVVIFSNSIRTLPTIFEGDPILSVPQFGGADEPCVIDIQLQPSILYKATFGVTPLNLKANMLSFGKVTQVNPLGIRINGQVVNMSFLGERDSVTLSARPSVIDFTDAFAYFAADSSFSTTSFPADIGNVNRFQVVVGVTIRSKKWPY